VQQAPYQILHTFQILFLTLSDFTSINPEHTEIIHEHYCLTGISPKSEHWATSSAARRSGESTESFSIKSLFFSPKKNSNSF
jgi:hypothetical protein